MISRSFLLLQGVASPFFSELEKALNNAGHEALKINFCGGDLLSGRFFSTALKHINYRGTLDTLPAFYAGIFEQHAISDIILFGDTRPVHLPAIKLAKSKNINIHVYEEGYFRPNWVTLDKGGVNAHSSLSKDPEWFINFAKTHQIKNQTTLPTGGGLSIRAWHDIRYHLAKAILKPLFPHYQTHRPDSALKEYWGFVQRIPSVKFYYEKKAKRQIDELLSKQKTFYLLPLQLGADAQIRIHSSINGIEDLIQTTIKSFAQYAPQDALLVIKNHPLDPWFIDYPAVIKEAAHKNKLDENRMIYLEAGNLISLLKHAKGTILVNSTVGTASLIYNCPVIALGKAIYNMVGLTFQGSLDEFWTQANPPDQALFEAFRASVIENTQVNGSFYNQTGIEMAVANSLPLLEANTDKVNKE
ncbi:MAG: capsular biosynthesis protein [Cocleimonas sp.]|nr:capsular biosynthesis protein [Cocleimonas sp.]